MYACRILADSINSRDHRLTSFLVTYPRFIHSEFLTHAMLVRNSESSRARPVRKNIDDVRSNPFFPEAFGHNKPGMQFENTLETETADKAHECWMYGAEQAVWVADELSKLEVHKSHANRVLEPYKWHTAIYTGTDWRNFFALRTHETAQPEFQIIAKMMWEEYLANDPHKTFSGEWHVPLVSRDEIETESLKFPEPYVDWGMWKQVSTGRCARVSYLTHDGRRDLDADISLKDSLLENHHMSPFGHVARPFAHAEWTMVETIENALRHQHDRQGSVPDRFLERMLRNVQYCGPYRGWWSYRADIAYEDDASQILGLP